jgi:hypothetical protein
MDSTAKTFIAARVMGNFDLVFAEPYPGSRTADRPACFQTAG